MDESNCTETKIESKQMKWILAGLMVLALGVAAFGMTGCSKSEHEHDSSDHADKKVKTYPLDVCIVTDEKLGEHGKPYVFTHEGQEIKMCCKDCLKDFKKEPAKYLKKITDPTHFLKLSAKPGAVAVRRSCTSAALFKTSGPTCTRRLAPVRRASPQTPRRPQ